MLKIMLAKCTLNVANPCSAANWPIGIVLTRFIHEASTRLQSIIITKDTINNNILKLTYFSGDTCNSTTALYRVGYSASQPGSHAKK